MTENYREEESLTITTAPFFAVSTQKLIVMSLATCGTYEIYWFYKNWKLIKARDSSDISPVRRSIFTFFFCYQCFSSIRKFGRDKNISGDVDAGLLTTGWIVTTLTANLPGAYFLISYISFLFLLPVQQYVNKINSEISPTHDKNSNYIKWNWTAIVIGVLLNLIVIIGLILKKH